MTKDTISQNYGSQINGREIPFNESCEWYLDNAYDGRISVFFETDNCNSNHSESKGNYSLVWGIHEEPEINLNKCLRLQCNYNNSFLCFKRK